MTTVNKGVSYGRPGNQIYSYYDQVDRSHDIDRHHQSHYITPNDQMDGFDDSNNIVDPKVGSRHQSYLNTISNYASPRSYNKFGFSSNDNPVNSYSKSSLKSRRGMLKLILLGVNSAYFLRKNKIIRLGKYYFWIILYKFRFA